MELRVKHKLVFLGNQYVGKTSIIEQFIYAHFDPKVQATVGIDFVAKSITVDGRQVRLMLWDTAGQEKFHSLIPSYLRDASCAIIVYDVTQVSTFESLKKWLNDVREIRGHEAVIAILANKVDMPRQVSEAQGKAFAQEHDLLYFETSAKLNTGIQSAMEAICLALPTEQSFMQTQMNISHIEHSTRNVAPVQLQVQQEQSPSKKKCC